MSHLQISKHISADFLAEIEKDFESILVQRNASLQNRVEKSKFYRLLNLSGLLLSGLGLLLSLLAATMSFDQPKQMAHFALFALSFGLGVVVFAYQKRIFSRLSALRIRLTNRISKWMAHRMLAGAKQAAPYVAEYDVRCTSVMYYRTKGDTTKLAWTKSINGRRMKGNGFSLFFKNETTVYPHLLILHDASPGWDAHLEELGIKRLLKGQEGNT